MVDRGGGSGGTGRQIGGGDRQKTKEKRREGQDLDRVPWARGRVSGHKEAEWVAGAIPRGMRSVCPPEGTPSEARGPEGPGPGDPPARCRCIRVRATRESAQWGPDGPRTGCRCSGSTPITHTEAVEPGAEPSRWRCGRAGFQIGGVENQISGLAVWK